MKKIIIVFVCLTLIFSSVGFSTAVTNDTIYVDDYGGSDSTSIQEMVDTDNTCFDSNVTIIHWFSIINLGNAEILNFQGSFHSIPVPTDAGTRHFGIGSFQFDVVQQDNMDGSVLRIWKFHRQLEYFHDITVKATSFIGWYQPTSDLSDGELSGFASLLKIEPLYV